MKTKKILSIVAFLIVAFFVYYAVNSTPVISDAKYTYHGGYKWLNDYGEGAEIAKAQNKPMFIYFWTIWCTYCEKFQTEVLSDKGLSEILQKDFVLIAVDMDINKEDTNRFKVSAPPHELFLHDNGEIITRIPGYVPLEQFLPVVKSVKDLHYSGPAEATDVKAEAVISPGQ